MRTYGRKKVLLALCAGLLVVAALVCAAVLLSPRKEGGQNIPPPDESADGEPQVSLLGWYQTQVDLYYKDRECWLGDKISFYSVSSVGTLEHAYCYPLFCEGELAGWISYEENGPCGYSPGPAGERERFQQFLDDYPEAAFAVISAEDGRYILAEGSQELYKLLDSGGIGFNGGTTADLQRIMAQEDMPEIEYTKLEKLIG